jgi:hypothetical protein
MAEQQEKGVGEKIKFRQFRSKLKKSKDGVNLEPKLANTRSMPNSVHDTTPAGNPGETSNA